MQLFKFESFDLVARENVDDAFLYLVEKYGIKCTTESCYTYKIGDRHPKIQDRPTFYNTLKSETSDQKIDSIDFSMGTKVSIKFERMDITKLLDLMDNLKSVITKFKNVEESEVYFHADGGNGMLTIMLGNKIGSIINSNKLVEDIKDVNRIGSSLKSSFNQEINKIVIRTFVINTVSMQGDNHQKYVQSTVLPFFENSKEGSDYINNGLKKPFILIASLFNITIDEFNESTKAFDIIKSMDDKTDMQLKYLLLKPRDYEIYS